MTSYNVHIYREMRITFNGIEADTPNAAASLACDKPAGGADEIEDCEGITLSALVDWVGDEEYEQSIMIDFEEEIERKAAPALLAHLKALIDYAENEAYSLEKLKDSPEAEAEAENAWKAVEAAQAAIDAAKANGIIPADIDIHALLASRRQIAEIWSIGDVSSLRPDLNEDQCWQVLQQVQRHYDAAIGIHWDVLAERAAMLFGSDASAKE